MLYVALFVLLVVVAIFGVSSGMQSYATAQQAQAQIEVAQVAQVSAWGNLVTILTLALVIVVAMALIILAVYLLFIRRKTNHAQTSIQRFPEAYHPADQTTAINQLVQLETLRMLKSFNATSVTNTTGSLPAPSEEESLDDLFNSMR